MSLFSLNWIIGQSNILRPLQIGNFLPLISNYNVESSADVSIKAKETNGKA